MNLHAVAGPAVAVVNPTILGTLKVSTGNTTNADFSRTPTYATYANIPMQVQALSGEEIRHVDALNIQGVVRSVWMNGNVEGLDRAAGKGGDLLVFNGQTWLVVAVSETWDASGWCHVIVKLQDGS